MSTRVYCSSQVVVTFIRISNFFFCILICSPYCHFVQSPFRRLASTCVSTYAIVIHLDISLRHIAVSPLTCSELLWCAWRLVFGRGRAREQLKESRERGRQTIAELHKGDMLTLHALVLLPSFWAAIVRITIAKSKVIQPFKTKQMSTTNV